jgi:hypothetical protein
MAVKVGRVDPTETEVATLLGERSPGTPKKKYLVRYTTRQIPPEGV